MGRAGLWPMAHSRSIEPFIDEGQKIVFVIVAHRNSQRTHIDGVSRDGLDAVQGYDKRSVDPHKLFRRKEVLEGFQTVKGKQGGRLVCQVDLDVVLVAL